MELTPVVYIFMNKSLQMSAGKLSAQSAHAMAMVDVFYDNWGKYPHRTILIMEARDEAHINNIEQYLKEREVKTHKIIDEGVNEIDPHSVTALATEVRWKDEHIDKIMSTFKLYRDKVKLSIEVDR